MAPHLVILSGSLRADSHNTRLAQIVLSRLPEGVTGELVTLNEIPPYDQDLDTHEPPTVIRSFRDTVSHADGVFICTPEYNYALPGVMKNAIDWLSRPLVPRSALVGRPMHAAVATISPVNGVRALADLRRFWSAAHGVAVPGPDCVINQAPTKFAPEGELGLDAFSEGQLDLAIRCLLRVVHSGVGAAIQENWDDYLRVLRS